MNNLIRKLADQVRFVSEPEYPDQDIIFERFAELIIRECAKAYHKTRLSKTPIETHFRNHFGIKE